MFFRATEPERCFGGLIGMQTAPPAHNPFLSAASSPAHRQLLPRLARRDHAGSGAKAWITPGLEASTAFINLSAGLVCVFEDVHGRILTHQQIGNLGLSAQQAWNQAAATLRATAATTSGIEFFSRPASVSLGRGVPNGVEIRGGPHTAAAWCAHPNTFAVLHAHFTSVLQPARGLVFFSRDQKELFIFDADAWDVGQALGSEGVLLYSVGFPLLMHDSVALV